MSRPTIYDVARAAGVGIGTVSRVLNNSPRVTPTTRQLVLDAIERLGFKPNTIARQLTRKTEIHNIGVITQPFINYHAFAERLRGVQMGLHAAENKYELVLYNISSLPHYDEQLNWIVQTGAVEGLIIIDLDLTYEQAQVLREANLPFVGINHFRGRDWPCIGVDNIQGGRLAAEFLLSTGHTCVAYVGDEFADSFGFQTSIERFEGFSRALLARGISLPSEYVKLGLHEYEVARSLALDLFRLPQPPTAVFAMCDFQALACLDAARGAGLSVPADVSIIGFDDVEISYHVGLTTIRQHFELSGRIGVEYLLRLLNGETGSPPPLPLPEVITRQTTRTLA